MSCMRRKIKEIVIPKGTIDPCENTLVEIPKNPKKHPIILKKSPNILKAESPESEEWIEIDETSNESKKKIVKKKKVDNNVTLILPKRCGNISESKCVECGTNTFSTDFNERYQNTTFDNSMNTTNAVSPNSILLGILPDQNLALYATPVPQQNYTTFNQQTRFNPTLNDTYNTNFLYNNNTLGFNPLLNSTAYSSYRPNFSVRSPYRSAYRSNIFNDSRRLTNEEIMERTQLETDLERYQKSRRNVLYDDEDDGFLKNAARALKFKDIPKKLTTYGVNFVSDALNRKNNNDSDSDSEDEEELETSMMEYKNAKQKLKEKLTKYAKSHLKKYLPF